MIFPADFLWGSATAAHQVEGSCTRNDWWVWEHQQGTLAVEPSGPGIDHFRRYDEDFALLACLGQNAHRLSLEWSRIEPVNGEFDEGALDHYRRVLTSLRDHGLTAVVTLQHKTLPLWFADAGGWQAPDSIEVFCRYVGVVRDALGDLMPFVCTINEPQMISVFGYLTGTFPPAVRDASAAVAVNATLIAAHRRAVQELRLSRTPMKVGICEQLIPIQPLDPDDADDVDIAARLNELIVDSHLRDLAAGGDVGDFIGLQYYTRAYADASADGLVALTTGRTPTTAMGWEIYPEGFGQMLHRAASTGLPVLVTENGIATRDDAERIAFLHTHLSELATAMAEGVQVLGYLHWSAFDNFEWNHGYAPTFGLVAIDRDDDFRRQPRESAFALGRVARTGDVSALMSGALLV